MNIYSFKRIIKPFNMAVISVFISIFSICAVSLISDIGKKEIKKELDGVGLNGMSVSIFNSYKENITDQNLYNILAKSDIVDTLTPVLYDYAQIEFNTGDKTDCMCWGISPTAEKIVNLERVCGRMLTDDDINKQRYVCLIDESMAKSIYSRSNITGKKIYISTSSGIFPFEIVGIVNKTSNILNGLSGDIIPNFIYIPFTTMETVYQKQNLDQILINVTDENIDDKDIEKYISLNSDYNNSITLKINNLSKQRDTINNIVDVAFMALFAVSSVAIIVCSISVATSVNTAVNAARRDIGIKLCLGARKIDIITEFLAYASIASFTGIISGVVAGWIMLLFINAATHSSYSFDTGLLLRGISATIFLSFIFSIYPSYQAASLLPVKALNRE